MSKSNPNSTRKQGASASELTTSTGNEIASATGLVTDVRALIDEARETTARVVNSEMAVLYWSIGNRIQRDILGENRAEYGKQILATLSQEL